MTWLFPGESISEQHFLVFMNQIELIFLLLEKRSVTQATVVICVSFPNISTVLVLFSLTKTGPIN